MQILSLVFILSFFLVLMGCGTQSQLKKTAYSKEGYQLVWSDEFNNNGKPDTSNWQYEKGFARNEELQWYQQDNVYCTNGMLVIEGRKENKINPMYVPGSRDWRRNRQNMNIQHLALILLINIHGNMGDL